MNREWGNVEIQCLSISSFPLHFPILSPFPLRFLFISSFSLHFLAARLQGCNDSCSPASHHPLGIGINEEKIQSQQQRQRQTNTRTKSKDTDKDKDTRTWHHELLTKHQSIVSCRWNKCSIWLLKSFSKFICTNVEVRELEQKIMRILYLMSNLIKVSSST